MKTSVSRIVSYVLLAYILGVGVGIEALNTAWGNKREGWVLPQWHKEAWTEGGGHGRMRGEIAEFQNILLLLGTWVYPASVVATYLFARQAFTSKSRFAKVASLLCAGACLTVLGRFLWLGVFTAGLGAFG